MLIQLLDPADDAQLAAVVELRASAHDADFPDDPPCDPEWEAGSIRHPDSSGTQEWWLAVDGSELLGALRLTLREADNTSTAMAEVTVRPAARRRGIGTRLATVAQDRAAESGRTLIVSESPDGGPAEAFARHLGFEAVLSEHRQRLDVTPESIPAWQTLRAEAAEHAQGYRTLLWGDSVPEEHLSDFAYLMARMSTDIPLDQMEWQPEHWDGDRIRKQEALYTARRRRAYNAGAVHEETGRLVAYTTLAYMPATRDNAGQWDTIVDPAHRGHRLGMLIKVDNLLNALRHEPETRSVFTWNALTNTHMNAINAGLGFRPVDRWWEWQLRVRSAE